MIYFQITVTPLGALSNADTDSQAYFKDWLPRAALWTHKIHLVS